MLQQAHLSGKQLNKGKIQHGNKIKRINHIIKTNHAELIPSIASLGVLNPNPTLFQNLFPPFPGLFPFPDFFELRNAIYRQNLSKYDTSISNFSLYIYIFTNQVCPQQDCRENLLFVYKAFKNPVSDSR
jgi:hypothetical protein